MTIRDLRLQGQGFVRISASHVRVRDVTATSRTGDGRRLPSGGNGMFFVWADRADVEDVEFYACTAYDCSTHGFNMNQDFSDRVPRTIRGDPVHRLLRGPLRLRRGRRVALALDHGLRPPGEPGPRRLPGANCIAESNWESGFHFEPGARLDASGREIGPRTRCEGVVLEGCIAKNNGWRNTDPDRFFMSGSTSTGTRTSRTAARSTTGTPGSPSRAASKLRFEDCSDRGSTYGWVIVKSSHGIALAGCRSDQARIWALWAAYASRLAVTDFTQTGAGAARGVQSMLGWYRDDPRYGRPVTDSSFEIAASGPADTARDHARGVRQPLRDHGPPA